MITDSISLDEILRFENNLQFLELTCPNTGLLMWPIIRMEVIRLIMSDILYSARPLISVKSKPPLLRVAQFSLQAFLHNLVRPPQRSNVLIYATGAGLIERTGQSFNRFTKGFSEILGMNIWSIEGCPAFNWPLTRLGGRLSFTTPNVAAINLLSRVFITKEQQRLVTKLVDLVDESTKEVLGWELGTEQKIWLSRFCSRQLAALPLRRNFIIRLLRRIKPKLLLLEEGCYGHMGIINSTAREYCIPVAEFQHGMVSRGHDAYNIGSALMSSEVYQRTLPNYFLSYGDWWNEQMNIPIRKVTIGNPYRSSLVKHLTPNFSYILNVLVLGDGIETDHYLKFCGELASLLSPSDYRVVFRPHPLERSAVVGIAEGLESSFIIDYNPDIYSSLIDAHAVIAEVSTGLFDAVGLSKRIFVWDTAKSRFGLPDHPFASFNSVTDLAQKICNKENRKLLTIDLEKIWASDWDVKFKSFIDEIF